MSMAWCQGVGTPEDGGSLEAPVLGGRSDPVKVDLPQPSLSSAVQGPLRLWGPH